MCTYLFLTLTQHLQARRGRGRQIRALLLSDRSESLCKTLAANCEFSGFPSTMPPLILTLQLEDTVDDSNPLDANLGRDPGQCEVAHKSLDVN